MVALLAAARVENNSKVVMSAGGKSFKEIIGERRHSTRNYGAACSVGQPHQRQ